MLTVEIQADSVDSNHERLDEVLRSADILDVENYSSITFKSQRIESVEGDTYLIHGDLTLRGITRTIPLNVTVLGFLTGPRGEDRMGYSIETTIDRGDFEIPFSRVLESGVAVVGKYVELSIEGEAVKES